MNQTVFTNNPFPKVGIRPIIDGRRRGVRESLEVHPHGEDPDKTSSIVSFFEAK